MQAVVCDLCKELRSQLNKEGGALSAWNGTRSFSSSKTRGISLKVTVLGALRCVSAATAEWQQQGKSLHTGGRQCGIMKESAASTEDEESGQALNKILLITGAKALCECVC
jgi:hypothetical protein